jgi:hypothetical protein
VADISYFDAWSMWLDGRSTLGNDLLGVSMLWWGRGGKIMAFVGGLTVVLDLVGPERIRKFSGGAAGKMKLFDGTALAVGGLTILFVCGITFEAISLVVIALRHFGIETISDETAQMFALVPLAVSLVALPAVSEGALRGVARVLENRHLEPVVRWLAMVVAAVGFHFDLLAS